MSYKTIDGGKIAGGVALFLALDRGCLDGNVSLQC